METTMTNGWDAIVAIVYILGFTLVVFLLRKPISSLLIKNKVKISLPGLSEIEISPADAGSKISSILNEFKDRYESLLSEHEKDLYRKICDKSSSVRVKDLIPDFDRKKPEHLGALRALRGIGLIVPEKDRNWNGDSYIVITRFGRAINEFLNQSL